ncbi:glycoside hydrolase family 97 protein [Cystobacter fuscus]|nr:glycoside hydrolase family 97 protein [Cystobacter fuscus]
MRGVLVIACLRKLAFVLCLCLGGSVASAATVADEVIARAASPGDVLSVEVLLDATGRLGYTVKRHGKEVIAPSRLGFVLTNAPKLDRAFSLAKQSVSDHDETWEQPWGERQFVRNRYRELRVDAVQKARGDRHLLVVFRIYDDGVGFRYEFPEQPQLKSVKISDELTEFVVADQATAWWSVAGERENLEYPVQKTPLHAVALANTPMTVKTDTGVYIAFHEAALVDFASMWLRRVDGQKFRAYLTPGATGPAVERQAPFTTPWRTMQISDSAPGLYMSDLILNLNEPNKLGDVSWVKPYKYVGVWWEMHVEKSTWGTGPKHGATTANVKRYIDFAARHGFRGVLVEGWNKGWDGEWFGNGGDFSFTESHPDFDLPALSAYAAKKGVRLIGHHETGGNAAHYEDQMDAAYKLYARHGVDSVKSGYVTEAGTVQFKGADGTIHHGFSDSQEGTRHFMKAVTEAARYKLAVNTHEPIKDTGLRRTYPNWVSREGARGMEYNAWGNPINAPDHEANLVFTRMLSGPMDYTPGILSLAGQKGRPIHSTQARQLANFVVIYSPIQMAADLPENYEKYPAAFKFIKDVPVDWADTRVINGEPGDYATFARKDRHGQDWYVGAVTDEEARTLELPLSFLDAGKRYQAEIYRDGDQADFRTEKRFDLVVEKKKTVTSTDVLKLKLAPGGGQAIRFTPLK